MATATWNVSKDTRIADNGSNLGAGASDYLPVGKYAGYQYRALLGFSYSWSGMVSITSAILHIKTSGQFYVAFGSSPSVRIQRITGSWSEGTQTSLSGSNASVYPGPSVTTTNAVTLAPGTAENTWKTADITNMIQDVFGGTFQGIRLIGWNGSSESTAASDVSEFYAREFGSNDAYIVVTYTTNVGPNAPTLTSPAGSALVGLTPTLAFTHSDNDGDALLDYDLQVSSDSSFASVTHWNVAAQTAGISGNNVSRVYAGTALTRGNTYYWRARTSSAAGVLTEGPWTPGRAFKVASLPVATLSEPLATGRLAKIVYPGASGWNSPRLDVAWGFSCSDGGTQASYEMDVANDSAGSPGGSLYSSGVVGGTAGSITVPADLTEGNYYHIRVRVVCSHGETSSYSGYFRVRSRWGVVVHRKDLGSAPTTWSVTTLTTTTGPTSSVTIEYGSDSAANATPSSGWGNSPVARYFYYRAWLLSWGASPATSPSLDKLVLSYSAAVLVPDKWTRNDTAQITVDESTFVYGTQSLKIVRNGSDLIGYQTVSVTPNTDYVLSGRIKSQGNSQAYLQIVNAAHTAVLAESPVVAATQDFTRVNTPVWNSGSNTSCIIRCNVNTAAAAGSVAWFDAIKFEASRVVTPWSPSFLAAAVVLDAGGLQIDGAAGGIFRLRGIAGGTRDRVDLGNNGLVLGGDMPVTSPSAGTLQVGDDSAAAALLRVVGGPSGNEGGQVDLIGAAAWDDWSIDNLSGELRIFSGGTVRVYVRPGGGSWNHEVNGAAVVRGILQVDSSLFKPTMSAKVIRAANQTITASTSVPIQFSGTDVWDPYAMHDPASNNTKVTVPWTGKFRITAAAHLTPVATLPTRLILELFVNGTAVTIGGIAGTGQRLWMPNAQTFTQHMQATWEVILSANDFVEINMEHNSATNQTLSAAECTVEYIGG